MTASIAALRDELGEIDIYLLDQILRGRIRPDDTVLDAGCGFGRNIVYLLRLGCTVLAADSDPEAVDHVRGLAASLAPDLPALNVRVEPIEDLTFPDACATVVIASAVLHFARDEAHFTAMVESLWRTLCPGGMLFARLATTIGLEHAHAVRLDGRQFRLGDGTTRFLADEALLAGLLERLGGDLADPLKTTVVQGQRCMTTWVARKRRDGGT